MPRLLLFAGLLATGCGSAPAAPLSGSAEAQGPPPASPSPLPPQASHAPSAMPVESPERTLEQPAPTPTAAPASPGAPQASAVPAAQDQAPSKGPPYKELNGRERVAGVGAATSTGGRVNDVDKVVASLA